MALCGICRCRLGIATVCHLCRIDLCMSCTKTINHEWHHTLFESCILCYIPSFMIFISNFYCKCCDKCVAYENFSQKEGRCEDCVAHRRTLAYRDKLPNVRAKDIIETRYIPGVAQIIFDYYYVPRRYFPDEH